MATGIVLSNTVSLLHNNLAHSSNGWVAGIHNSVNAGGGRVLLSNIAAGGISKDGPESCQAMSIRYLELPAIGPALVVCSTNGTQVYNEDASNMLFYLPIHDSVPDAESLKHHQGCCVVTPFQHIAVGTSKGSLQLISAAGGSFVQLAECATSSPSTGVVDVCFSEASGTVVSVHSSGELRVWAVNETGPYTNANIVPAVGQAPMRVSSLGPRLMVAYGAGTICLFDAVTFDLQVELTAHARWITAVDVREDIGWVMTVGEDTALNVWHVDAATGRVGLQHTATVTDKLLTGVALHGSDVYVSAYDSSELYRVNLGV